MAIDYVPHGDHHRVAIVYCPTICERLLHFSHDDGKGDTGWRLRDFITKHIASGSTDGNEIEELVKNRDNCAQLDLQVPVTDVDRWKLYLETHSKKIIENPDFVTPPRPVHGIVWEEMA